MVGGLLIRKEKTMDKELPPREMIALGILLASVIGRSHSLAILNKEGQKNFVSVSFEIADEYLEQSKKGDKK